VEVDGRAGQAMLDDALAHAFCGVGSSSTSHRRFAAATSLLGAVHVGSRVSVVHRDGTTETKTVERLQKPLMCRFPAAGAHAYPAKTVLRSDGVAVITVPSFLLPTRPALSEDELAEAIAVEFDKAKTASGIVWDLRGNPGGATMIALAIVGGMPGFARGTLAKCASRKIGSMPFEEQPGTAFVFQPSPSARFAFRGKVAVAIDGLTTSAGDYFALAASTMTHGEASLVGAETAGAYGGVGEGYEFGDLAPLRFTADVVRCTDPSGAPLERRGVVPSTAIELEPDDLANGRDTVLEAAAARVR
jgi:C-terminal processing protease CtpA/Prc